MSHIIKCNNQSCHEMFVIKKVHIFFKTQKNINIKYLSNKFCNFRKMLKFLNFNVQYFITWGKKANYIPIHNK